MPPWARKRAAGSGNALREPMASCDPAGRPKEMAASVSKHWRLVTASKWSMTRAMGLRMASIAATRRRGTSTPTVEDVMAPNTAGSIGSTRFSAIAMEVARTAGSLSWSSNETHPTRGRLRCAHCASRVVLP